MIVEAYSEYVRRSPNMSQLRWSFWAFIMKRSLDSWWFMDHCGSFSFSDKFHKESQSDNLCLDMFRSLSRFFHQIPGQARTHVAGSAIGRRFGCWSSLPIETPETRYQQPCDIDINIDNTLISLMTQWKVRHWRNLRISHRLVILVWELLQAIQTYPNYVETMSIYESISIRILYTGHKAREGLPGRCSSSSQKWHP
jgi:hypothetical protein